LLGPTRPDSGSIFVARTTAAQRCISAASSACSSADVPAGAASAFQLVTCMPATPACARVGTSGSSGWRCTPVTASARTTPACSCGSIGPTISTAMSTSPARSAVSSAGEPL